MIRNPNLITVRSYGNSDRVDPDVDTRNDGTTGDIDNINGVSGRVHDEDVSPTHGNRSGMRTHKRRMSDGGRPFLASQRRIDEVLFTPDLVVEGNLLGARDHKNREANADDQNPGLEPAWCTRHLPDPHLALVSLFSKMGVFIVTRSHCSRSDPKWPVNWHGMHAPRQGRLNVEQNPGSVYERQERLDDLLDQYGDDLIS
ncbi:MAG TPA: hypothetical protein EYO78_13060, partial [Gammaproteobacteria bacterium]|nr:hypothetical protein [Gammaproteobacteria bacterium]